MSQSDENRIPAVPRAPPPTTGSNLNSEPLSTVQLSEDILSCISDAAACFVDSSFSAWAKLGPNPRPWALFSQGKQPHLVAKQTMQPGDICFRVQHATIASSRRFKNSLLSCADSFRSDLQDQLRRHPQIAGCRTYTAMEKAGPNKRLVTFVVISLSDLKSPPASWVRTVAEVQQRIAQLCSTWVGKSNVIVDIPHAVRLGATSDPPPESVFLMHIIMNCAGRETAHQWLRAASDGSALPSSTRMGMGTSPEESSPSRTLLSCKNLKLQHAWSPLFGRCSSAAEQAPSIAIDESNARGTGRGATAKATAGAAGGNTADSAPAAATASRRRAHAGPTGGATTSSGATSYDGGQIRIYDQSAEILLKQAGYEHHTRSGKERSAEATESGSPGATTETWFQGRRAFSPLRPGRTPQTEAGRAGEVAQAQATPVRRGNKGDSPSLPPAKRQSVGVPQPQVPGTKR